MKSAKDRSVAAARAHFEGLFLNTDDSEVRWLCSVMLLSEVLVLNSGLLSVEQRGCRNLHSIIQISFPTVQAHHECPLSMMVSTPFGTRKTTGAIPPASLAVACGAVLVFKMELSLFGVSKHRAGC
jgi:hypothetical protein